MFNSAAQLIEDIDRHLSVKGLRFEDRFEVSHRIGHGSYAEIYVAKNLAPEDGEPPKVVVKALNPLLQGEIEAELVNTLVDNFKFEAETMVSFDHENIARFFGSGFAFDHFGRSFYYLILEYIHGANLAQSCSQQPLSFIEALKLIEQICSALSYVHRRGILHRDIKPTNIMVSAERGRIKLFDFGTARDLNKISGFITQVGTEIYAAPEHFSLASSARHQLTPAADVYALAKTVYFMLGGSSPAAYRQRQIIGFPTHLTQEVWAPGVLDVLKKATFDEPDRRYQSVQEFFNALQEVTELTTATARPVSNDEAIPHAETNRIVIDIGSQPGTEIAEEPFVLMPEAPSFDYLAAAVRILKGGFSAAARIISLIVDCLFKASFRLRSKLPAVKSAITRLDALSARILRKAFCQLFSKVPIIKSAVIYATQVAIESFKVLPFKFLSVVAAVIVCFWLLLANAPSLIRLWQERAIQATISEDKRNGNRSPNAIAKTDINLRSKASGRSQKIGLVEKDSRIRILSFPKDSAWCEIKIIEHARPKEDPASRDSGWVNKENLQFE